MHLDPTHDPAARCWLAAANGHPDFPIQNLPIGVFRRAGAADEPWRGGVAVGDAVLDLAELARRGLLTSAAQTVAEAAARPVLNDCFALGRGAARRLRHELFALLSAGVAPTREDQVRACLVPAAEVTLGLPARIGDYTDFYTSIHHALNVGRLAFPDRPLTPNFQWLPIAYHGRASSVVPSGTAFHRPMGQRPGDGGTPAYGPCQRLDYELEMGCFVGAGNRLGERIAPDEAEEHLAGMCLLNDWSARDIQFWEMAPLGPFLGKNFCTTISPWVVGFDALAPFRLPFERPAGDPAPLAYLDGARLRAAGALDIELEVCLETAAMRRAGVAPHRLSRTNFRHQYWTVSQMVAQHTVGGCNLQPGDLIGTGTISGPAPDEAGAIIELTKAGREPIVLPNGEQRAFLQDGDTVICRAWCERPGAARIGFGECRGTVLPAVP